MRLKLYDENLTKIKEIGGQFVSCLWEEGYNTTGKFTLELQPLETYRHNIKPGYFVGRNDRKTMMIINAVEYGGETIVLTGQQANKLLDDIAFIGTINENSLIDKTIINAYNSSDNVNPLITFSDSNLGITYPHQISHKSIWELCEEMCQTQDMGYRLIRNDTGLTAEFYQPKENKNLKYSDFIGNLSLESITNSNETYKNYAIVLGQGEGDDRIRVDVDQTNGEARRELIVDANDLQQDTEAGESLEAYKSRLTARGAEKLLEQPKVFDCVFSPNSQDFGTRFDLGDMITVTIKDYGVTFNTRVKYVSQTAQDNKVETSVQVGDILNLNIRK